MSTNPITIPEKIVMASGSAVAYTVPDGVEWIKFRPDNATTVHTSPTAGTSTYNLDSKEVLEVKHRNLANQVFYFTGTTGKFVEVIYGTEPFGSF